MWNEIPEADLSCRPITSPGMLIFSEYIGKLAARTTDRSFPLNEKPFGEILFHSAKKNQKFGWQSETDVSIVYFWHRKTKRYSSWTMARVIDRK